MFPAHTTKKLNISPNENNAKDVSEVPLQTTTSSSTDPFKTESNSKNGIFNFATSNSSSFGSTLFGLPNVIPNSTSSKSSTDVNLTKNDTNSFLKARRLFGKEFSFDAAPENIESKSVHSPATTFKALSEDTIMKDNTGRYHLPIDKNQIGTMNVIKSTYTWKLNAFGELYKESDNLKNEITSPMFLLINDSILNACRLCLYPNGKSIKSKGYLSLFLQSQIEKDFKKVIVCFSILNNENKMCNQLNCHEKIDSFNENTSIWGSSKYIKKELLWDPENNLLPNGNLVIVCDIILSQLIREKTELKVYNAFESLFESKKFSDLTLKIDEEELKVHKCVLAARSPTFRELLEEEHLDYLEIKDFKYVVMKEVLRFIYTNKVEKLPLLVEDLLSAAHKYKLNDLKIKCEEILLESLNISNAINILVQADECNASYLKRNLLSFIASNGRDVIDSPEYKNLVFQNPKLLDELFCEVVKREEK